VLVGIDANEDTCVYRINDELALLQTVDYITPLVDDPYDFGAIAAANSLSDIYAMGAKPIFALNLIGFPSRQLSLDILEKIVKGGADKASEAGINIIGGHTIDDPEPKYGLVVTALLNPNNIITNSSAKIGDGIILTKPLGMGIITTGFKKDLVSDETLKKAVAIMSTLNKTASQIMVQVGVSACTDVTGFGLLGHLHEMMMASRVGARIKLCDVPVVAEAWDLVKKGIAPGGTHANHRFLQENVVYAKGISQEEQLILCDAQTSGGLLISVPKDREAKLLELMKEVGVPAAKIGEVIEDPSSRIEVIEG